MEPRKITVVHSKNQKKYVLNTDAETLGQLVDALNAINVSTEGMVFMEGLTRTEMMDLNSILPTNVVRTNRQTGETTTTNELVFLVTNEKGKIASGADRKELYTKVKSYNLQDAIKEAFGKNFTNLKTDELEKAVAELTTAPAKEEETISVSNYEQLKEEVEMVIHGMTALNTVIAKMITVMDALADKVNEGCECICKECCCEEEDATTEESPYSDSEIYDMFNF